MRPLTPDNSLFILVSFEGPDLWSQAGGLGVRIAGLSRSLAEAGWETHLFFIGDPTLPGEERQVGGRLTLHRWGQWISRNTPTVYHGEDAKRVDMEKSLPRPCATGSSCRHWRPAAHPLCFSRNGRRQRQRNCSRTT